MKGRGVTSRGIRMIDIGGASLRTSTAGRSQNESLETTLSAAGDDTDIETVVKCRSNGIRYESTDGTSQSIEANSELRVAITNRAIHVLPDGDDTAVDDIGTVPLADIEDVSVGGLVRRTLVVETADGTYTMRPGKRSDLDSVAQFLRRTSWAWSRVAPRLATARAAIETLDEELADRGPGPLEREKHRAKLALSKAQSGASRLDVAVDAIESEIEQLREQLRFQRVRWYAMQGEQTVDQADDRLAAGLVHSADSRLASACDHYEAALENAQECALIDSTEEIRLRLETIRERLYDLEVHPVMEAHDAVERACNVRDTEAEVGHWEQARSLYQDARREVSDESAIRFQLAWVDANLVDAHCAYADMLETDADGHAENDHERWAKQLYMAADDHLEAAYSIAREQEHLDTTSIELRRKRLEMKRSSDPDDELIAKAARS